MVPRQNIRRYVESYMPVDSVCQFLTICSSLHPDDAFYMREFNLGYQKSDGSDGFSRFHQFRTSEELKKELIRRAPCRVDAGGILATETAYMKLGIVWKDIQALEKEFVVDIDINDYDDIRACDCTGKTLCPDCWEFLGVAAKTVDYLLRVKFGCSELLWIYSGRRGVHCWVLDRSAARFSVKYRRAIVAYLSPFTTMPDHRVYNGSCKIVSAFYSNTIVHEFEKLLETRALHLCAASATAYIVKIALATYKNTTLTRDLITAARPGMSNIAIWNRYKIALRKHHPDSERIIMTIVLSMVFPRIDAGVSVDLKHLVKCPFSWHPRTGSVCVPFDVHMAREFNPHTVPNINNFTNFAGFEKWLVLLDATLLDLSPTGQKYVCLDCVDTRLPLRDIPRYIVFNEPDEWVTHYTEHDHDTTETLENSRLSELVRRMCSKNSQSERSVLKKVFYDQLMSKFS